MEAFTTFIKADTLGGKTSSLFLQEYNPVKAKSKAKIEFLVFMVNAIITAYNKFCYKAEQKSPVFTPDHWGMSDLVNC